jgi:hypothetical protein
MPTLPILPPIAPHSPRTTPATYTHDWNLIWILVTVFSILVLEFALALSWLRIHNIRSKARWRNLRKSGVIVVNGPTLIWVKDLPPRRMVSHFNLREAAGAQEGADLGAGEVI